MASVSARLFNEVNYERRQQFFRGEKVDLEGTWDKYYERYEGALGVDAQAVLQKNNGTLALRGRDGVRGSPDLASMAPRRGGDPAGPGLGPEKFIRDRADIDLHAVFRDA